VNVTIGRPSTGRAELRYELTRFWQNQRLLIFSRIDAQLQGEYVDYAGLLNAVPFRSVDDSRDPSDTILPSGILTLSVFNDSFARPGGARFE